MTRQCFHVGTYPTIEDAVPAVLVAAVRHPERQMGVLVNHKTGVLEIIAGVQGAEFRGEDAGKIPNQCQGHPLAGLKPGASSAYVLVMTVGPHTKNGHVPAFLVDQVRGIAYGDRVEPFCSVDGKFTSWAAVLPPKWAGKAGN